MNTNAVADIILASLVNLHPRTTRNKAPQSPISPYVVFYLDSLVPTTPSNDFYLNVDVYDKPDVSVRAIEDIADNIQSEFDCKVIRTESLNLHLVLEQRQFISNTDLTTAQMINLRFVVRAYFM
jgi:hypothetical protein